MTNEQFGDDEENLAHMELDNYLMDLSTMMEVDEGEGGGIRKGESLPDGWS